MEACHHHPPPECVLPVRVGMNGRQDRILYRAYRVARARGNGWLVRCYPYTDCRVLSVRAGISEAVRESMYATRVIDQRFQGRFLCLWRHLVKTPHIFRSLCHLRFATSKCLLHADGQQPAMIVACARPVARSSYIKQIRSPVFISINSAPNRPSTII
jgi:hypothetical protein